MCWFPADRGGCACVKRGFSAGPPLVCVARVTDVCCGRMRRVNTCRALCPMRTIFRSWWKRYHSCGGLHLGSVPLLLQHPDELRFAWHLLLCCRFCIWIPWNTESVGPLFFRTLLHWQGSTVRPSRICVKIFRHANEENKTETRVRAAHK